MPARRERVLKALSFQTPDQIPKDLGGMNSTGISAFAYPKLVAALGLPYRRPRVHDTGQMLALPDLDVLDALDCDVITVHMDWCTNAFEEPERWHEYDFNGRLSARVMRPEDFRVEPDGTIVQWGSSRMVPDSYVFDAPHGGQELDLSSDPKKEDLDALASSLERERLTPDRVKSVQEYCRRARQATDRAIMFNGLSAGLGFRGGIANFSMLCLMDPGYVRSLHEILIEHAIEQARRLLPAIAPYVDVLMLSADDHGTQNAPILPPAVFRELFVPYYRRLNDAVHELAPGVKTFLHCCGAVYDILDCIIDAGFDVLNPVQWSAGGHSYKEWKDVCRGRIALWGGGVNTQTTLPLGTVAEVSDEVRRVVEYLSADSGYVFCAIHNILAEIPPEKVIALYRTASEVRA